MAKIKIGTYRGRINRDKSIPEFLMPTTKEAPIEPIRLRHGVAIIKVKTRIYIPSEFINNAIPRKGDNMIIGSPESVQ